MELTDVYEALVPGEVVLLDDDLDGPEGEDWPPPVPHEK